MGQAGMQDLNKQYLNLIENYLKDKPDYLRGYVNYLNNTTIRTKYYYLTLIWDFVSFCNKPIEELSLDDFNNFINSIKYKEDGSPNTSSYQITVYSAVKRFSGYLFVSKKITDNYMLYISKPKARESQTTVEKRARGYLTEKEIKKYIDKVEHSCYSHNNRLSDTCIARDKAIILLFLNTGIRCSALKYMDIQDIDFQNRTIIVTDKGEKVRVLEMSKVLYKALKEYLNNRDKLLKADKSDLQALFISINGNRMTEKTISNVVQKYAKGVTNKHITPHKLRATYGTQLYNKTGDIYFVQDCMGHNDPKTTELYVRGKKHNTKRASEIMEKLLE